MKIWWRKYFQPTTNVAIGKVSGGNGGGLTIVMFVPGQLM